MPSGRPRIRSVNSGNALQVSGVRMTLGIKRCLSSYDIPSFRSSHFADPNGGTHGARPARWLALIQHAFRHRRGRRSLRARSCALAPNSASVMADIPDFNCIIFSVLDPGRRQALTWPHDRDVLTSPVNGTNSALALQRRRPSNSIVSNGALSTTIAEALPRRQETTCRPDSREHRRAHRPP